MMDWITPYAPAKIPEEEQKWKISVSVAIYKIEDLLPRCVESLLSQTYRNLEIILVDDGHGPDDPLHLVAEVKGYRYLDANAKKSTMETLKNSNRKWMTRRSGSRKRVRSWRWPRA